MRNVRVLPLILVLLAVASLGSAQTPVDIEFLVTSETPGIQLSPQVAMNARGQFVVAWIGNGPPTARDNSFYVRRYEADGRPATDEIKVHTPAFISSFTPRLAMMEDGSFVVVFPQLEPEAVLRARRYAPDGTPVGEDVVITRSFLSFEVAPRGDGGFVVAWDTPLMVRVQSFRADGEPLAPAITLDSSGALPDVAVGPEGEAVVIWEDIAPSRPGNPRLFIRAQRLGADGAREGRPFQVTAKEPRELRARVAKDRTGNFLVIWAQGSGSLGRGTFTRWYRRDGSLRTGLREVGEDLFFSDFAMDARGNFVLVWEGFAGQDTFGQRFTSGGRPFRPVFRLGSDAFPGHFPQDPVVASDAAGNFVVVWGARGPGGDPADIFARLFRRR